MWRNALTQKAEVGAPSTETVSSPLQARCSSSRSAFTDDQFRLPFILEYRPSPEFNYEAGKDKLVNLHLFSDGGPEVSFVTPGVNDSFNDYGDGNEVGCTDRQGKILRLSAWIDMESRLTVGCAGALLTYIRRRKAVEYLPSDEMVVDLFGISTIEMFSLKDMMYVAPGSNQTLWHLNNTPTGSLMLTRWHLCKYYSQSRVRILTTKAQRKLHQDQRKDCLSTVSSTTLQERPKVNNFSGHTSCAQAWTWT